VGEACSTRGRDTKCVRSLAGKPEGKILRGVDGKSSWTGFTGPAVKK
jgi:hypothetical protein